MPRRFSHSAFALILLIIGSAFVSPAHLLGASTDTITRVSVGTNDEQGNAGSGDTGGHSISGDGRYVAFYSDSTTFDSQGRTGLFIRDRIAPRTTVFAPAQIGTQAPLFPYFSGNSRYITFSGSSFLVGEATTQNERNVFQYDRTTGNIRPISQTPSGVRGNDASIKPSSSFDGSIVVFDSRATNLTTQPDSGQCTDILLSDGTNPIQRISSAADGTEGNGDSVNPAISPNGRYVAFESLATNLLPPGQTDTNGQRDIYVFDRQDGKTYLASVATDGSQANSPSFAPSVSDDGKVVFISGATNLDARAGGVNGEVYLHDLQTGQTILVTVGLDNAEGNNQSFGPVITGSGAFVAFDSRASNLVANDQNDHFDVFRYTVSTRVIERISLVSGVEGNGNSYQPSIAADGNVISFLSNANNLVPDDTNNQTDVFAWEQGDETTYSITGRVSDVNNNPVPSVLISIDSVPVTTTDNNGSYMVNGLLAGTYTLLPSKDDYTFSPTSLTVSVPPDVTGQNFIGKIDLFTYPIPASYQVGKKEYDIPNPSLTGTSQCYGVARSQLYHAGEDWFAPIDTPVQAIADGVVYRILKNLDYPGAGIIIKHTLLDGTKVWSVYAHLDSNRIRITTKASNGKPTIVVKGQVLADGLVYQEWIDENGIHHPNIHLHWEIRYFDSASELKQAPNYTQPCTTLEVGPGYTFPGHPDNFKGIIGKTANGKLKYKTYRWTNPSQFVESH